MGIPLNVLLVEDSADDAELVLIELRRGGFEPQHQRVETHGAMAGALAARSWDLVLSDYRMPGFGGMEALGVLQASGQDLPFILVSGAIGEEGAVAAVKAGAHGFVSKERLDRLGPAVARELKDAAARAEARQAKEELRRSEARYRALFEHSPIPLSLQDFSGIRERAEQLRAEGTADLRGHFREHPEQLRACAAEVRILEENQASLAFHGADREDPATLAGMLVEASWPVFLEQVATLAGGAASFHGESPLRAANGCVRQVALDLMVVPGHERTLARVLVSFVDVTDRNQMAATLRDLDRLSVKGQMAAYIAHEINNPLAGIKNAFSLLEPAIPADHPHRRFADLIQREIDRIASIIRTMYGVYRPASQELTEVALAGIFQDIRNLLAPKCRAHGVEISITVAEDLRLRCNEGLLRQVLFNLVQNAVEASPRDGVVGLAAAVAGTGLEIRVDDQGAGIPPEQAEQVFEPGFTTKRASGMSGLGLGLSTCKGLVETLGGRLWFTSPGSGHGCSFRVRLPVP